MSLKIVCEQCNSSVVHECHLDLQEAFTALLSWVPEHVEPAVLEALKKSPWYEHGDEDAPFFGSQGWSYPLLSKEEARTFHALLRNLATAAGYDIHELASRGEPEE